MTTSQLSPQGKSKTNHNQKLVPLRQRVPEILAPVGGREQFFAALNAGADAVFLGLKQFNARARAENFTTEDLLTLVPLAHRYGMQVLVTLNILIKDIELPELIRTLSELEDIGVDAIIVQDLGVAEIARKHFPGLRLHASTQMAVHNLAGVQKAYEWGFKRVVLARELTAQEIKRIRSAVPKELIELEVFCHGSLCYSYSGLCFFSGAADARSGNRGECAYTCREPYKVLSEPGQGFLFSMRDLDTSQKLNLMIDAGVDTLKIEGRKKDAQYVASVVRLYRSKLNDLFKADTLRPSAPPLAIQQLPSEKNVREDLQLSFQRQTTSFFFAGRYHENVIDLNSPTHQGLLVGRVEHVDARPRSSILHIRLEHPVEKFDGLKVVRPEKLFHAKPQDGDDIKSSDEGLQKRYDNKETAFSLRELFFKGRRIFEASPGMLVEIEVDTKSLGISPTKGDLVYKVRSADLKRRIESITAVPVDERLRPLKPLSAKISTQQLSDGALTLTVRLLRWHAVVAEESLYLPRSESRRNGTLTADLKESFAIFGTAGYYTQSFDWGVDETLFIPKSQLKNLKRSLEESLLTKCSALKDQHLGSAQSDLQGGGLVAEEWLKLQAKKSSSYEIKVDRLPYLNVISDLINTGQLDPDVLAEVIFEPKKMYLDSVDPQTFMGPLKAFTETHQVSVRVALPTVIRAWDEPVLKKWCLELALEGFAKFEVGNPGALGLLEQWGIPTQDVTGDFMLYGLNRKAVSFWQRQGLSKLCLSIEDDLQDISSLLSHWPDAKIEPVAILYKDTPLFVAESCSLTALHNGCPTHKVCGYRSLEIENSKGERFVVAHEGCKSIVYGKEAYSIAGQRRVLEDVGVRCFRVDFLTRPYTDLEVTAILNAVLADQFVADTHTANFLGTLK